MSTGVLRFGFLIKNGEIFDTKIMSYELKRKVVGDNIIHYMKPIGSKRLDLFEPLLDHFDIDTVFRILEFNSHLKRDRKNESKSLQSKLHYMSNASVIYHYPPTYLTNRRFNLYKLCQQLKRKLA